MSLPHATVAQTDFSAGQIDLDLKRSDDASARTGARQLSNFRILNSKRAKSRPGRRAVYPSTPAGRTDQVLISAGIVYDLQFGGDGSINIRNSAGTSTAYQGPGTYPWSDATIDEIVWCVVNISASVRDIIVCFPGMQPKIFRWRSDGAWFFLDFTFPALSYGGLSAPFYALSSGAYLTPSDTLGTIILESNVDVFSSGQVGTFIQWLSSQILITGYTSPTVVTGVVQQQLPFSKNVHTDGGTINGYFAIGDIVQGSVTNYQAEVVAWNASTGVLTVNMLKSGVLFNAVNGGPIGDTGGDTIVGPNGTMTPTVAHPLTLDTIGPQASAQWTEMIFGSFRGWPKSCFFDQGRLGFTNIPSLPRAIVWCAVDQFYDFLPGANPTDAIFELMAETAQIYHVIPGDGGEIVMTDVGVFYIPINENNPLKPGSVSFRSITPEGSSAVKPIRVAEGVLYVNAGLSRITLVVGSGAATSVKPYTTLDVTKYHASLFSNLKSIAVTQGDGTFAERYIYSLDTSGRINCGLFDVSKNIIGWTPWNGAGFTTWLSALQSELTFTAIYPNPGGGQIVLIERLDDGYYLDALMPVNVIPPGFTPAPGSGPFWWFLNGSVMLMDQVTRVMGVYQIDGNGFIIPQNKAGEDLASLSLVGGQPWTDTYEPFIPQNGVGQTVGQRMKRRKIARWAISVIHATGFTIGDTVIPSYNMGEDATLAPPLREETVTGRKQGRDFDPRLILMKDTPGPFTLIEAGAEVTV